MKPAKILGTEDGFPVVACNANRSDSSGNWLLTFKCPWCGRIHTHGGCDGVEPSAGHRLPHCYPWELGPKKGYILRVVCDVQSVPGFMDACEREERRGVKKNDYFTR